MSHTALSTLHVLTYAYLHTARGKVPRYGTRYGGGTYLAGFGKLGSKQHCLGEAEGATSPGPFPSEQIVTRSSFLSCSPWGLENSGFALFPLQTLIREGEGWRQSVSHVVKGKGRKSKGMLVSVQCLSVSRSDGRNTSGDSPSDAIRRESVRKRFTNTSVRGQVPEQQNASLCGKQCLI